MLSTTPEEILWSFRSRLRSRLPSANAGNCEIVRDLDDADEVQRTLPSVDGFAYLIEPGAIMPLDGFDGGGICNEYRAMRITVEVWRIDLVDSPMTGDGHLVDLAKNVYSQAAAVIHAISSEPLTQREGDEEITAEIPSQTIDYIPNENKRANVRIPFDVPFDWDIERHNPQPEYTG